MTNCNVIIPKWASFVTEHDIWIQWNTGQDIYTHIADKLREDHTNSNHGYELLKFLKRLPITMVK